MTNFSKKYNLPIFNFDWLLFMKETDNKSTLFVESAGMLDQSNPIQVCVVFRSCLQQLPNLINYKNLIRKILLTIIFITVKKNQSRKLRIEEIQS